MPNAPRPAGLSSQTPQGGGARLVRRFGGAVRGVIAGGIAIAGRLRRPAAPEPRHTPPAPRDKTASPAPRRPHVPPRPRAAAAVAPPQQLGWLARWFGPRRRQPTARNRAPVPDSNDAPFTTQAYPGLSPEACALFNTPVEDCDPEILRVMLAVLARHIADSMGPALGQDAETLFATLCGRLGTVPGDAGPDAAAAEAAVPMRATPAATAPDLAATAPAPADQADATAAGAAGMRETTPDAAPLTGPVRRRSLVHDAGRPLPHRRRSRLHRDRSRLHRGVRHQRQRLPSRRLCYAACAGPP